MKKRGFNHKSYLDKKLAIGLSKQDKYVDTVSEQREILKNKKCDCKF